MLRAIGLLHGHGHRATSDQIETISRIAFANDLAIGLIAFPGGIAVRRSRAGPLEACSRAERRADARHRRWPNPLRAHGESALFGPHFWIKLPSSQQNVHGYRINKRSVHHDEYHVRSRCRGRRWVTEITVRMRPMRSSVSLIKASVPGSRALVTSSRISTGWVREEARAIAKRAVGRPKGERHLPPSWCQGHPETVDEVEQFSVARKLIATSRRSQRGALG